MSDPKSSASRFSTLATTMVLVAAFSLMTIQGELAGSTANIAAAKSTFRAKCAMCHGPDGAGSEVGKTMHVPDFRSSEIQKTADSELAEVIANGKNGMPSFKGSLNAGQIHDMVAYIRTFAKIK